MSRSLVLALVASLVAPQLATAAEIMVSTDATNNSTLLADALANVQDGDTLFLLPGAYEPISLTDKRISIMGYGEQGEVVLSGLTVRGESEVLVSNVAFEDMAGAVQVETGRLTLSEVAMVGDGQTPSGALIQASSGATLDLIATDIASFVTTDSAIQALDATLNMDGASLVSVYAMAGSPVMAVDSDVRITNSVFRGNASDENGGSVSLSGGTLDLSLSMFDMATAGDAGGHLFLSGLSAASINEVDFIGGQAAVGGALALDGVTDALMGGCLFADNTASYGGAMVVSGATSAKVGDLEFSSNTADMGGHLYVAAGRLDMTRAWMVDGSAEAGAAMALAGGRVRLSNVAMVKQARADRGGAIFQEGGLLDLRFSVITENGADEGAALMATAGSATIGASILVANDGGAALHNTGSGTITIGESILVDNEAEPAIGAVTFSKGLVVADPMFVDPTLGYYMVQSGSPALDSVRKCAADLDGTACDMGVFGGPKAWPLPDTDADGFTFGRDCNDQSATINESAEELANDGIDQDCDGYDVVE